ncbi:MAG: shikimate dehydrogenase [Myxococcaceae bacterium]|nr:shikimate dehydrogenase [Myxococcaceae bacterium]
MSVRVVTLPRGADAATFAARAKAHGADALEVRDDLTETAEPGPLPLLLAHRGGQGFGVRGQWEDRAGGEIASVHFERPLTPEEAERHWAGCTARYLKHVEPLGDPTSGARLLETQARLVARFGEGRVTVLATGDCALPWRAILARRNAFDYLALDATTASAPGQRLMADAVRAGDAPGPRLAIIGHQIAHARSPRLHAQPFDRWDLPPDAPVRELVDALRDHYRGFAITAPFKRAFGDDAVNTLVRRPTGWATYNTDVDGARAVVKRHGARDFTVLGDGGAAWALRRAGARAVLKAAEVTRVSGDVFWTWPAHVSAPAALRLDGARVFVIAYGAPATRIAGRIRVLGGTPVRAGHTWFIAQARAQRRLWWEAS